MDVSKIKQLAENYVANEVGHNQFKVTDCRELGKEAKEYKENEKRYFVFMMHSYTEEEKKEMLRICKPEEISDATILISEPTKIRVTVNSHRVLSLEWLNIDF